MANLIFIPFVFLLIIFILYLIKLPAKKTLISSSLIWEKLNLKKGLQKNNKKWISSLLISILIALFTSFLFDRENNYINNNNKKIVIVIDNSTSMLAIGKDGYSRFYKAKLKAKEIIENYSSNSKFILAATSDDLITPYSNNKEIITDIENLEIGNKKNKDVLKKFSNFSAMEYHFISDGVSEFQITNKFKFHSVYEKSKNIGITKFVIDEKNNLDNKVEGFIEITNANSKDVVVDLKVSGNIKTPLIHSLEIPGNSTINKVLDLSNFDYGRLTVSFLDFKDSFSIDDVVYSYIERKKKLRVAVVSKEASFFKNLKFIKRNYVDYDMVDLDDIKIAYNYDLYIFYNLVPKYKFLVPSIYINPPESSWLFSKMDMVYPDLLENQKSSHPVMKDLLFENLNIVKTFTFRDKNKNYEVLLKTNDSEPIVVSNNQDAKWLWIGFDPDWSNIFFNSSFPLFFNNALRWLTSSINQVIFTNIGDFELSSKINKVDFMGNELAFSEIKGNSNFRIFKPGFYNIHKDKDIELVIANLLDKESTLINNYNMSNIPHGKFEFKTNNFNFLILTFIILFLLLILESYTFNKKITE